MFDVRPTKGDGSLDFEKIKKNLKIVRVSAPERRPEKTKRFAEMSDIGHPGRISKTAGSRGRAPEKTRRLAEPVPEVPERRANIVQMGKIVPHEWTTVSKVELPVPVFGRYADADDYPHPSFDEEPEKAEIFTQETDVPASWQITLPKARPAGRKRKAARNFRPSGAAFGRLAGFFSGEQFALRAPFLASMLLFSLLIPSLAFLENGLEKKTSLLASVSVATAKFASAKENIEGGKFDSAAVDFGQSYDILNSAHDDVAELGGTFSEILRFIPGVSKIATANYAVAAGRDLASAGKVLADSLENLSGIGNPLASENNQTLTEFFLNFKSNLEKTDGYITSAMDNVSKIDVGDLPPEAQAKFLTLKEKLPLVHASLSRLNGNSEILLDILGYNGPRKFLLLFQNNQEMRATGGFIGSYGIVELSDGHLEKMLVDDIYNPDGQLKARVIPPEPIQKMSAVWTMHDANWFPDFPTSAEKIAWFYEKTGGPTVDGVIAMTPTLIQKLLAVTGPIEMPEYDTVVDENNFIEKTQQEVEVDYDKEENKPKKFLADLTPKILDKVFSMKDARTAMKTMEIFGSALREKQLLIYSKNFNVQKLVSDQGWSGEVLNTPKDYLSVINSNINGFKTDGVIDESIDHQADIASDGTVTDEVTITRKHNGGNTPFDWWNKVNASYMRVYVPEGSKLLEASGQTREYVSPPLDYDMLGFKKDPQLAQQDDSARVDDATGTKIYDEDHKTVFANWAYVSPGETVVLKYKYILPFKISIEEPSHPADSFSVLYQKQSGSMGSKLSARVNLPDDLKITWKYPDFAENSGNAAALNTDLSVDRFFGFTLERK